MARDEQSNGSSNGSSGKSGRQDSSLSARRARLRSLAKQALPPDPYSKKQEGSQPADNLELEFMSQQQEAGGSADPLQQAQPSAEPWLDEAMKSITAPDPTQASGGFPAAQPPISPIGQDPQAMIAPSLPNSDPPGFNFTNNASSPSFGGLPAQDPSQFQMPDQHQFPPDQEPQFPQDSSHPQFPPDPNHQFPQDPSQAQFSQDPSQHQTPGVDNGFGSAPSFESFMQGPPESPTSFMSMPQQDTPPPFGLGASDPAGFGQFAANPFGFGQPQVPVQSQAVEAPYLQHTSDKNDFTSKLDLDYGDLDDTAAAPATGEPDPAPQADPQPIAGEGEAEEPESRPWEINTPTKKENAWSVGTEDDIAPEVTQKAVEPEPEPEPVSEKVEEPVKEAAPPSSKKKSRRKSDSAEEPVEKEPEMKAVEEEALDEKSLEETPEKIEPEQKRAEKETSKKNDDEKTEKQEKSDKQERLERKLEDPPPSPAPESQSSVVPVELLTKSQAEALELLTSIDQALGICAMNLSSLQTAATEQTDVLKNLRETLQNQTFFELGLNLNTLMESMSAALEPMKAVGELVPAIDQLVSTMVTQQDKEKETRLSPDKLVMGLADQLGAGQIDPWTFKCAYMAVYPDEHPADLLHRLVELLGTQRLSGDMFRSAYDAVQAAEPPRSITSGGKEIVEVVKEVVKEVEVIKEVEVVKVDEEIIRQLEDLKRANEDLRALVDNKDSDLGQRFEEREREFQQRLEERERELNKRLEERETEYAELLASKEHEIQETQEMLHSRFEEFNSRYEEMVETVNQRDEELKVKDEDLMRKESEITQLKAQLDELKDSFKDTVDNLQKQLQTTQKAAQEASLQAAQTLPKPDDKPKPTGSFFDQESSKPAAAVGGGGFGGAPMETTGAPGRPLFQQQMDTFNSMSKGPPGQKEPFGGSPPTPGAPTEPMKHPNAFGGSAPPTGPIPSQEPSNQAVPKPPQPTPGISSPLTGTGSYGSGVRAQVFEVIVRQALAGAPWREICAGPMSVNNISPEEVEAEVKRREQLLKK